MKEEHGLILSHQLLPHFQATLRTLEAKMLTSCADLPSKTLHIKKDDRFFSRRLTSEIITEKSSLDSYHRKEAVAVPFMWESQPGTPKHRFREAPLPPLTPPPSYFFNSKRNPIKSHSKQRLLHNVIPKLTLRKTHLPQSPASTSSSASWSSSRSVPSSPMTPSNYQRREGLPSPRFSYDSMLDEEEQEYGSPVSILCFGAARGTNASSRGCYSGMIKLLLG